MRIVSRRVTFSLSATGLPERPSWEAPHPQLRDHSSGAPALTLLTGTGTRNLPVGDRGQEVRPKGNPISLSCRSLMAGPGNLGCAAALSERGPEAPDPYISTTYSGWGGRIRTSEWRNQNPLPYRLATPQWPAVDIGPAAMRVKRDRMARARRSQRRPRQFVQRDAASTPVIDRAAQRPATTSRHARSVPRPRPPPRRRRTARYTWRRSHSCVRAGSRAARPMRPARRR